MLFAECRWEEGFCGMPFSPSVGRFFSLLLKL